MPVLQLCPLSEYPTIGISPINLNYSKGLFKYYLITFLTFSSPMLSTVIILRDPLPSQNSYIVNISPQKKRKMKYLNIYLKKLCLYNVGVVKLVNLIKLWNPTNNPKT